MAKMSRTLAILVKIYVDFFEQMFHHLLFAFRKIFLEFKWSDVLNRFLELH